ncbi:MAG: outer membrane protein transport protein [Geobacteraceae bacterium]|nr:outer membrane protein transport protein [Geobacteraceae bacterium]
MHYAAVAALDGNRDKGNAGDVNSKSACLLLIFLLGLVFILPMSAYAQMLEFSSSMNPVGSGARATGMGGAFIAVADDATAASWNPAGLIHLEKPEISAVYSYMGRSHAYHSSTHPELAQGVHEVDLHDLNYASVAYPFTLLDRNIIITVNYQRLYDMNKYANINYRWDLKGGDFLDDSIAFSQQGYLGAISPAIAIQILPDLYFGATVNIWDDFAGACNWKNRYESSGAGSVASSAFSQKVLWTNKYTFSGLNSNLGLLYTLDGKYSLGFVYKTPFTASVSKETSLYSEQRFPAFPSANSTFISTTRENISIEMPASYGFGFAYRHSDSLMFALDVYRTQWSDFAISDALGNRKNPITGADIADGKPHDTTQVRLGGEYLFIGEKLVIPVRGGMFYDPEPGKDGVDDFYGFSVGSGIVFDKYAFDFSYQYRWGNRVTGDIPQPGVSSDISQHNVMASLIYHF